MYLIEQNKISSFKNIKILKEIVSYIPIKGLNVEILIKTKKAVYKIKCVRRLERKKMIDMNSDKKVHVLYNN